MTDRDDRDKRRSQAWFNPEDIDMAALYLERYTNSGRSLKELRSGRPVIGIAQTGSDLSPCNQHLIQLAARIKDGIKDAGGVAFEFPVHPLFENARRPTAALDRNLAFLGLVEVLRGHPLDGVVLTTGCDKTTPACLMAVACTNTPAIVLSGGPMLNAWVDGKRVGSGSIIWEARRRHAAGEISDEDFIELAAASAPSAGHCNTMGTALSMNGLAEALGMSLPGCAAIPAPHKERGQMAYDTGRRAVEIVEANLKPSDILTRSAFLNAIRVATALGASSNCPPHLIAIARHMGVELSLDDWHAHGESLPLLCDVQPAGQFLGEEFHRAGGVPAVMGELLAADCLDGTPLTVTGDTVADNLGARRSLDREVIKPVSQPLAENAGFMLLSGNFFETALLKMSVVSESFRSEYLADGGSEVKAVVFEGPEDYRQRIDDPALPVNEDSILIIRNCGPVGYPGSAEVVNMRPPAHLVSEGVLVLPTMGDGRQSGTSASPSILNMTPEAAIGGGLALLQDGDTLRIDLAQRRIDVLLSESELDERRAEAEQQQTALSPKSASPWEIIYREHVGGLDTGACLEFATEVQRINDRGVPRHNH
ncbi:MAG: IlvD/Edd family dehydratase [Pseudomonadota bacterium]